MESDYCKGIPQQTIFKYDAFLYAILLNISLVEPIKHAEFDHNLFGLLIDCMIH